MECSNTWTTDRQLPTSHIVLTGAGVINGQRYNHLGMTINGSQNGSQFTLAYGYSGINIRSLIPGGVAPQGCQFTA